MAVPGGGAKDDKFNVLDLAEYTKNRPWWRKIFAPNSGSSAEKYNVATQLVIGGVTGWCTGFIFQKVGKLAATAVGGGFFLLQVANHTGYIKVDWNLVQRDMNKAKQQLKFHSSGNEMPPEVKSRVDEVIIFLKKNVILTEVVCAIQNVVDCRGVDAEVSKDSLSCIQDRIRKEAAGNQETEGGVFGPVLPYMAKDNEGAAGLTSF